MGNLCTGVEGTCLFNLQGTWKTMTEEAALSQPPSLLLNVLKQEIDCTRERNVHVGTVYNRRNNI